MNSNLPGLPKTFSLAEFIPKEASEDLWEAYFTLSETIFREFKQKGRLPDRDVVKRLFSTPNPFYSVKRWMVFDKVKRAVAFASISYDTEISPDYESNRHLCQIHISVVPAYRRKKIATNLLKHLVETAKLLEKTTVITEVDNPLGLEFRKQLRGDLVHEEILVRIGPLDKLPEIVPVSLNLFILFFKNAGVFHGPFPRLFQMSHTRVEVKQTRNHKEIKSARKPCSG